jgi:hypothetical protein
MKFDIIKFKKNLLTNKNVQLLIHPLWWMSIGSTRNKKLKYIFNKKKILLKNIFKRYENILNKI